FGVVPKGGGMEPGVVAGSDCGHWLALCEHLGVGADANLEILRPGACFHERILKPRRRWRARLECAQIFAQNLDDLLSRLRCPLTAAARAFLDDALKQGLRECHAGRFDSLQVDGSKQARARRGAAVRRSMSQDIA